MWVKDALLSVHMFLIAISVYNVMWAIAVKHKPFYCKEKRNKRIMPLQGNFPVSLLTHCGQWNVSVIQALRGKHSIKQNENTTYLSAQLFFFCFLKILKVHFFTVMFLSPSVLPLVSPDTLHLLSFSVSSHRCPESPAREMTSIQTPPAKSLFDQSDWLKKMRLQCK